METQKKICEMVRQREQPAFDTSTVLRNPAWLRALTLTERLGLAHASGDGEQNKGYNAEFAERKLKRWKEQYPFDKNDFFATRLELDGLSEDELRFLLGESGESLQTRLPEIPAWLQELACVYEQRCGSAAEELLLQLQKMEEAAASVPSHTQTNPGFLTAVLPLIASGIEHLRAGIAEIAGGYAPCFHQERSYSPPQGEAILCPLQNRRKEPCHLPSGTLLIRAKAVPFSYRRVRSLMMQCTLQGQQLETWMETAQQSNIREMQNFVAKLRKDQRAVQAGLTLTWSNGVVEGHANRLKLLKRTMYGRAKFDLLRRAFYRSSSPPLDSFYAKCG